MSKINISEYVKYQELSNKFCDEDMEEVINDNFGGFSYQVDPEFDTLDKEESVST